MEPFVQLAPRVTASEYKLLALTKAKGKAMLAVGKAKRSTENKYEGYKYVDIESLHDAIGDALDANGLVMSQYATSSLLGEVAFVTIITRLTHLESGEWEQVELDIYGADKSKGGLTPKSQGAAITYGRKYSAKTILGIADANDPDADKEANPKPAEPKRKPRPATEPPEPTDQPAMDRLINPAERRALFQDCHDFGASLEHIRSAVHKVTGSEESKLIKLSQIQLVKEEAYKFANPQKAAIAAEVIP